MLEKLDMDKLQKLVYYINNVKMSGTQRDRLNGVIISGIVRGELDTDELLVPEADALDINEFFTSDEIVCNKDTQSGKWIQAAKLYDIYCAWCDRTSVKAESASAFGRAMKELGLPFKKKSDGNYYQIIPLSA